MVLSVEKRHNGISKGFYSLGLRRLPLDKTYIHVYIDDVCYENVRSVCQWRAACRKNGTEKTERKIKEALAIDRILVAFSQARSSTYFYLLLVTVWLGDIHCVECKEEPWDERVFTVMSTVNRSSSYQRSLKVFQPKKNWWNSEKSKKNKVVKEGSLEFNNWPTQSLRFLKWARVLRWVLVRMQSLQ